MKFTRRSYFFVIILMILAITYFPVFSKQLPPVIGSHYLWSAIWGASLLIFYPKVLTHRLMIIFFGYALFIFIGNLMLWPNLDEWNKNNLTKDLFYIAVGLSIYLYFLITGEYRDFARIIQYVLVFLLVTSIITIIVTSIDPMYSRIAFDKESETETMAHQSLQKIGAGGYGTAIVLMTLFPMLIYYFKSRMFKFFNKWFILLYGLIIFFTLIRMQIFANVLIGLAAIFISFAGVSRIRVSVITVSLLIIISVSIPKSFYVKNMIRAADYFEKQEDLSYKLRDMAVYLETGQGIDEESAAAGRLERYPILYESFIKSPVFGCFFFSEKDGRGYNNSGAHLYWMNKITVTGIVGLFFFLYLLFAFIKTSYSLVPKKSRFYFIISIFTYIAYGFFKNLGGHTWYAFFVIIPGIFYLPLLRKNLIRNKQGNNDDMGIPDANQEQLNAENY